MKAIAELVLFPFFLGRLLTSLAICFIIIRWLSRVSACELLAVLDRIGGPGVDLATRATLHCLRRWITGPLSPREGEVITLIALCVVHWGLALIAP